ncbi:MAG: peptidase S16 [Actinobacteria bacterium]|nr:peptidase S16 [Actinomycetota bacterium]
MRAQDAGLQFSSTLVNVDVIPLFPLSVLLVPGLVLPLHIFEPRYRQMVSDLMTLPAEKREFGLISLRRDGDISRDGIAAMVRTGTAARIDEVTELGDGRSNISTVGTRRFRILELLPSDTYFKARVEWLDENITTESSELAGATMKSFYEYTRVLSANGLPHIDAPGGLPDDPNLVSYIVATSALFDSREKQELLDIDTTDERLEKSRELLDRERRIISTIPSLPASDLADSEVCPN